MATFIVDVKVSATMSIQVEATSEDEAIELAKDDMPMESELDGFQWSLDRTHGYTASEIEDED